jgi:C4-dicarboxylate-binding protein DctP
LVKLNDIKLRKLLIQNQNGGRKMKKRRIILFQLVIGVIAVFLYNAKVFAQPQYIMKFAISTAPKEYHYSYSPYLVFKNEVETRSNGRISVQLFPGGQLGKVASVINQVRRGVIQGGDCNTGHLSNTYPPIQVLSIPYLFEERDIAWKVLGGPFGDMMIENMAKETGIRALYWGEGGGFRHFSNNKREIRSPEDMKGLKIRSMNSPFFMELISNTGASATPIAWNELYTSLQTGVADGQENSIATFLTPKLEEVQRYITLDGHVYSITTLIVNEKFYQELPDDLKQVVQSAAGMARAANYGITVVAEANGLAYLEKKGLKIYKPKKEEIQMFRAKTQPSSIKWLKGEFGDALVDDLLAATAKAEKELGYYK